MYKSTEQRVQSKENRAKSTDNRVLTDNKTLFCHFERRREISELRPQVRLTLRLLLCILFVVVDSALFDAKSAKNFGTREKQSSFSWFRSRHATSFSRKVFAT